MEDTVPLTDVRRRILQDIWNPRLDSESVKIWGQKTIDAHYPLDSENIKILQKYLYETLLYETINEHTKDDWTDINKLFEEEL